MKVMTKKDLVKDIQSEQPIIMYFYTPLCGTCQVAKRMLDVTKELFPDLSFGMMDVNYIQELAVDWQIESVPCLIVFKNGEMKEKIYAFRSVEYLYELFKKYQAS